MDEAGGIFVRGAEEKGFLEAGRGCYGFLPCAVDSVCEKYVFDWQIQENELD